MKLSKESEYGLVALIHLASQPVGTRLQAAELAEAEGLPAPFLAKILGRLTRHGILRSSRGRQRGYQLARPPAQITARAIHEAIEGPDVFQRCVFWAECSDSDPCPLHDAWRTIRPLWVDALERTTLEDLTLGRVATTSLGSGEPRGTHASVAREGEIGA